MPKRSPDRGLVSLTHESTCAEGPPLHLRFCNGGGVGPKTVDPSMHCEARAGTLHNQRGDLKKPG